MARFGLVALVIGLLAMPANAQIEEGQLGELEARRDSLTEQLTTADETLAVLDIEIADVDSTLVKQRGSIELAADAMDEAVEARQGPAGLRNEIAVAGFIGGDPRRNALIDEFQALQGSQIGATRREFYGAVIDGASVEVEVIDGQIRDLTDVVVAAREEVTVLEGRQSEIVAERDALRTKRDELSVELERVLDTIQQLEDLANQAILTGLTAFNDPTRPALVVKIDNVEAALPQAGINVADLVYEEEVEGGLTRLAAVFHSDGADVVGPVRSMRTSDIGIFSQLNRPLFANSGGNPITRSAVAGSFLVDIGAASVPDGYYRDTTRRAPHNLFTNTYTLWSLGEGRGAGAPFPLFAYRLDDQAPGAGARPAAGVTVKFGRSTTTYDWNGTGWVRAQNGEPTVDTDNVAVAPPNVVVQFVQYGVSPADQATPEAFMIGSGPVWVLTAGQVIEGSWRRDNVFATTEFVDGSGNLIPITKGRTWIALPRPGDAQLR